MLSIGVNAKIVFRDLHPRLERERFERLISLKRLEPAQKCMGQFFVDFDICQTREQGR